MAARVSPLLLIGLRYLLTLWLAVTLLFAAMVMLRGNPISLYIDPRFSPELQKRLETLYGYDAPTLVRYGRYLANTVSGELGISFTHNKPVSLLLRNAIGKSLWLGFFALALSLPITLFLLAAQTRPAPPFIRRFTRITITLMLALPPFVVAALILGVVAPRIPWLPRYGTSELFSTSSGFWQVCWERLRHSILPGLSLAIPLAGNFSAYLQEHLVSLEDASFITSARGRGIGPGRIFFNHQLRTLFPSLIQLWGLYFPALAGGVLVVEALFGWNGLGVLLIDAVLARDYPLLLGGCIWCSVLVIPCYELADHFRSRWEPRI